MTTFPNAQSQAAGAIPAWVTDPANGNYLKPNADGSINITANSITPVSLGQAAMAASVPVAIASNQSTVPVVDTSLEAQSSALNLTTATRVKNAAGRVFKMSVIVAGSAVGTVNDCATTGAAAVANQLATIPNTVGTYELSWPFATALVVVPGTGQTVAVSYT